MLKHQLMFQEFLALKNVSLKIRPGEAWGLVGTKRSGKVNDAKAYQRHFQTPHKGSVQVNGTIAPLIELGAGFDMELTARENIYLNGTLLGHSRRFMDEHFDEIVDFRRALGFFRCSDEELFLRYAGENRIFHCDDGKTLDILICG